MLSLHVPPAEVNAMASLARKRVHFPPSFSRPLAKALLVAALSTAPADARQILWGSRGFAENADSKGRLWDATYSLSIGAFKSGFVPTFENRGQWTSQWIDLGTAEYDFEEKRFAGSLEAAAHPSISSNSPIYFWAKNGSDLTRGPEWVLLTDPSWKWPAASSSITLPLVWTTGGESISLIIGEKEIGGKHLVSRALRPVPISKTDWLAAKFAARPDLAVTTDDADGDGQSNTLEYFLGTDPTRPTATGGPQITPESSSVRLALQRNPFAESGYILEASEDLKTWFKVEHQLLTDRPDLLETSIQNDPTRPTLFFRFQLHTEAK